MIENRRTGIHEGDEAYQTGNYIKKLAKRQANIKRFKQQFPDCKDLPSKQVLMIFKFYKKHCERSFQPTNLTMLTTGTLFILITGLFINGGAGGAFSAEEAFAGPNAIVMNTVISSATSGLTYMLANQISNLRIDNSLIQQTGLIQNYNIS